MCTVTKKVTRHISLHTSNNILKLNPYKEKRKKES
uniref:Uncharacterized protein n=1 Tax=Anguilla anguilla TaxID=7936 RepID=A0A0E9Q067_ANGAN